MNDNPREYWSDARLNAIATKWATTLIADRDTRRSTYLLELIEMRDDLLRSRDELQARYDGLVATLRNQTSELDRLHAEITRLKSESAEDYRSMGERISRLEKLFATRPVVVSKENL